MLTPAQQKVKQELEELQLKAQVQPYAEEPPPNKSTRKKWSYIIAGFCAVVIISSFLLQDFTTSTQDETISYLKVVQSYNKQSSNLLRQVTEQETGNLQQAVEKQAELVQKVGNLKAPSGLSKHKLDLLDVMQQRLDLITYLAEAKNRDAFQINKKLLKLKVAQGLAAERLADTFDREKIKYVQQEDGTIEYWVDTKVYQYHF
ncbi:hypothetical protein [Neobacillus sp. PS2-9]|uniref:hypothetical protein n=1 Tax=Neobacillus sp. PS2-9 TaxID=3070676 RepID=UPI0027DEF1B8|nr:hypothetical protein [Neobacillus sp. PS2-9]WML59023.1 hypothetical protein RCG25_04285 [Neobacillus sp. PS2-9]